MKVNSIQNNRYQHNPSFGLKIKSDKEFKAFLDYAKGKNWGCNPKEIKDFIAGIRKIHYPNEGKGATTIAFGPIFERSETIPVDIQNFCFLFSYNSKGLYTERANYLPYMFFNSSVGYKGKAMPTYCVKLPGCSLKDVEKEILGDYVKYKSHQ